MSDEVITRLYRCLVEAIRELRPDAGDRSLTVAEIYQDLVPYRAVRGVLGIGLNADYEHAMLRLLAGEGGYVTLEPPEAQKELQEELESPNPNVGIFRTFAACDAWVRMPEEDEAAGGRTTRPAVDTGDAGAAEAPASVAPPARDRAEAAVDVPFAPADPAEAVEAHRAEPAGEAGGCVFCHEALPEGRDVRFCPYCGADQRQRPCGSCGEPLEPDWRFCIACGARVSEHVVAGG